MIKQPHHEEDGQPFKEGEDVVAVDALPGSEIKNHLVYKIYSCELAFCKGHWYWYVGVTRGDYKSHNRVRPSIFAPLFSVPMKFEKLAEEAPIYAN